MDCARRAGAGGVRRNQTVSARAGPEARVGNVVPPCALRPVIADDDVPVGDPPPPLGPETRGAASVCRSLGQCARWAPAAKDTDEPIYR